MKNGACNFQFVLPTLGNLSLPLYEGKVWFKGEKASPIDQVEVPLSLVSIL
jgi:hypothetical protein